MEGLEPRAMLAAGISFDPVSRILTIVGSEGADTAEVRQQGSSVVVTLDSASGRFSQTARSASVTRIAFAGLAGNDAFTNLSRIPSRADGGGGDDVLRGGRAADELLGGDGIDRLFGEAGPDLLDGGDGDDSAWGGFGDDRVMGGAGHDKVYGDGGIDDLWGGLGNDTLDGGVGNDTIRGEDGNDALQGGFGRDLVFGGRGSDDLSGGAGSDSLEAGEGNDVLNGELGVDRLVGGEGLDRELDTVDRFVDGDDDGDGFDNDYDFMDVLYESPGSPSRFADDASVAPTIAFVTAAVRDTLKLPAGDDGLRVRVQKNQFGDLVTGLWRYMTPDRIQVWGRWCQSAADPSQLKTFVQFQYTGPYSGNIADYSDPANYVVSDESRFYAGYLNGPTAFISWLPGQPAGFFYSAPNEQATGFPAPLGPLTDALRSLPNMTVSGDSFSGDLSTAIGLQGVQPVIDLLRTIEEVNRAWYARLRSETPPVRRS